MFTLAKPQEGLFTFAPALALLYYFKQPRLNMSIFVGVSVTSTLVIRQDASAPGSTPGQRASFCPFCLTLGSRSVRLHDATKLSLHHWKVDDCSPAPVIITESQDSLLMCFIDHVSLTCFFLQCKSVALFLMSPRTSQVLGTRMCIDPTRPRSTSR